MTEFIFEVRLKVYPGPLHQCKLYDLWISRQLCSVIVGLFDCFFEAWFHVVQAALKLSMEQMIALNSLTLLPQIFQTLGLYHHARTRIAPHFQT